MFTPDDEQPQQAFDDEIAELNEKYILGKPIRDYYIFSYRPNKIQGKFGFHFLENIDLNKQIREECINLFNKHFPGPEGVHGLIYPRDM